MEDLKTQLAEVKSVEFRGTKFNVRFPNVGQMLDIENLKTAYSGGRYGIMLASGVKSMLYAVDTIDAIVFVEICAKQIYDIVHLQQGQSLMNIGAGLAAEITSWYKSQIYPWYSSLMAQLYEAGNSQPLFNKPSENAE